MTTTRRPIMVLGCTSDAGKSLIVTALCRAFRRRGLDVAPFKAQNMSNNARVVDGGEIGVAQWLQAKAAGRTPTVAMNPVLLKPEADTRSQVVVDGRARHDLSAMPWIERGPYLWAAMAHGADRMIADHELVVMEGAGSPAEINLPDYVNNRMTAHVDAVAVLVADIDRGGAFAHLVGTHDLAPETTRRRLAGFVLNKFRGDASLLTPAPEFVTRRTGMADFGVLPMLRHHLPDEEGATVRGVAPSGAPTAAVIRWPFGSNLDEWHLLPHAARVRWATTPADLDGADLVVLPGSKHLAADAAWLAETGLDVAIRRSAAAGTRVLGVCGGAMLLGRHVEDPDDVEGPTTETDSTPIEGLGLLDLTTTLATEKLTRPADIVFSGLPEAWRGLEGRRARGYEIRNGRIEGRSCQRSPLVWADGNVLATTAHGLFESPDVLEALTGERPADVLEATFEALADAVEQHLDLDGLLAHTER